jgi:hypothetical protein
MKRTGEARNSSHIVELLDKQGPCLRLAPASVAGRAMPEASVAFRDLDTGLLRIVQSELVVRFHPGVSERLRQFILRKHGLGVRRANAFILIPGPRGSAFPSIS